MYVMSVLAFYFILVFKFHVAASIVKLQWAKILGRFLDYLRLLQKGKEFLRNTKFLSQVSLYFFFSSIWEIYLFRNSKHAYITYVVLLVETIFAYFWFQSKYKFLT